MQYDKLIILHTANYSRKIRDFFSVDLLIEKGYDVEFWNCGGVTVKEHLSPVITEGLILVDVNSISDLDNYIRQRSYVKCLFLSYINYASYSYELYKCLSINKVELLYAATGYTPAPVVKKSIMHLLKKIKINVILNKMRRKYYTLRLLSSQFVPLRFVMESSDIVRVDYKESNNTEHIVCNSGDFENFKDVKPYESIDKKPYAVFIDQYLPYHNDIMLLGGKLLSPIDYYNSINKYFELFELQNSCSVIIAAHPSSEKYKKENPFNGRLIKYNKTAELIKGAICVLAHYSTAISFAVLGYKPLVLLTSDLIVDHYFIFNYIQMFGKELGCDLQNVDHPTKYKYEKANRSLYDLYKYKYLTTKKTEKKRNIDIIESIVKGNYQDFIK